jgi:hypothetical protein
MSYPAGQQRACACSAVKRWLLAMLDNRAEPRSSPRGCGAAKRAFDRLRALRQLGREAGAEKRHSQPNKETDLQGKEDVRIRDGSLAYMALAA